MLEVDMMSGNNTEMINDLLKEILEDRGVPRNIKASVEESIGILKNKDPEEQKVATIISILDDASNDPNLSPHARTKIWNMVSVLESLKK
jgi:uncharacterized protein (UPF0147 family)